MLIGDGRLELDAPAPVEEWQADGDPRREITLEDLLRMSSGLEWEEQYGPGSIVIEMLQAPHAADVPISQELVAEPGTEWEYSTGTTAILADIAADELGGGDALDTYVHERLLDPLGMTSTVLLEDSTGTWFGGLGADSTPRDLRQVRVAVPARRRVGRRADPSGGMGRRVPLAELDQPSVRAAVVDERTARDVRGARAVRPADHRRHPSSTW